jgi:hypothetical protein
MKVAIAMFAETLEKFKTSTRLIHESRSYAPENKVVKL